jgi:hypothetical protein
MQLILGGKIIMLFIPAIVSSVTTFISSCISTVGPLVAKFASSIVAEIPKILQPNLMDVIKVISNVAQFIGKVLGLVNNETAEELGAKAAQCDRKPEEFESTEKYIEYLRNEVKLDEEKIKNASQFEKIGYSTMGVALLSKGISEKMDVFLPTSFWVEVGKQNLKGEEAKAYIDNFKSAGLQEVNLSEYLQGKLDISENKKVFSVIESTLKQLNPNLTDNDIEDKIFEMKEISRNIEGR